ncbi:phosphatidylserine decarboxylase-domain-containing protein [Thamnocephalis sphaerospora]|uniref:Phosphatidylserine decarboxylase-domain-containing protein n=1 Tax=Thamnocephalis sphaerospora TaxID=78915 RepID=A0A4V1IX99_9FUNG|nr:phosphatidylserine decarboxylase-domain-containing protein [Thamnocephalis sphaerospora]|eukprot:RKP10319.1 phosphatidylserine decarboxylase-domain-containing protein [Thamnocephalis sphaerospora]
MGGRLVSTEFFTALHTQPKTNPAQPSVAAPLPEAEGSGLTDAVRKMLRQSVGNYVVNRADGRIFYEHMEKTVRATMVAAYSLPAVATSWPVRKALKIMTSKKGKWMDDPQSVSDIPRFVDEFQLDMSDYVRPNINQYKTFNDFFTREIKDSARPVGDLSNPRAFSSPADARTVVFPSVKLAQQLWIKGKRFTTSQLLDLKDSPNSYDNATLVVSRLAPQDYHCFHAPVSGTIMRMHNVTGEYYTVNPLAVRRNVNVFTENVRVIMEIQRQNGQKVQTAYIGATLVASMRMNVRVGQWVNRGDKIGCFAFGGSTIVTLAHGLQFDNDLVQHTMDELETLVTARSRIGEFTS